MTLKMWYNDGDFVIAETPEEADKHLAVVFGDNDPFEWQEWPADKEFTLYKGDDTSETKTIGEWITERGEGFFATSDY